MRKIQSHARKISAIAINAGVGVGGASFDKTDLAEELNLLRLNVVSVVHLTKRILPDMIAAGEGRILFTSSVAAFMPGPYESVYSLKASARKLKTKGLRLPPFNRGRPKPISSTAPVWTKPKSET